MHACSSSDRIASFSRLVPAVQITILKVCCGERGKREREREGCLYLHQEFQVGGRHILPVQPLQSREAVEKQRGVVAEQGEGVGSVVRVGEREGAQPRQQSQ